MGRSTKGKVNTTTVSTDNIREVLNSDRGNISQRERKASVFFTDNLVPNNIYEDFIDGEYCPPAETTPFTKKLRLQQNPKQWGHFRNYGGVFLPEGEELPEIYWKTALDFSGVNQIPQSSELSFYNTNKYYPGVILAPPLSEPDVAVHINSSITASKNLGSERVSILFRPGSGSFEKYLRLNTKVGLDYSTSYSGTAPVFKIKVTPFLGDVLPSYEEKEPLYMPATINYAQVAPIGPAAFGGVFNYFQGGLSPVQWGANLGNAAAFVYAAIMTIMVADIIWDIAQAQPSVVESDFQYKNLVKNIYNFTDIDQSKIRFGFGNKNEGYDSNLGNPSALGSFQENITNGGKEYQYNLSDFNYQGTPFSSSNLINEFPTNSSTRDKYLNMTFSPEGIQYDYDTPPPGINYFVELIPVQNCKLSTTKPTAFVVATPVHKYKAPNFNVITPSNAYSRTSNVTHLLYRNSPITFSNAKYCDFVGMIDTETSDLFTKLQHFAINTDGWIKTASNYNRFFRNKNLPYVQNNISTLGEDVLGERPPGGTAESLYDCYFYRDSTPQLIRNPFFRLQAGSDVVDDSFLKTLWTFSNDWQVRNGAIYKDGAGSGESFFKQIINITPETYYFLTLEYYTTSGNLVLDCASPNGLFISNLYVWEGEYDFLSIRPVLPTEDWPTGVSFAAPHTITFNGNGVVKMLLKSKSTLPTNREFKINAGSGFTGRVVTVKLQQLPEKDFTDSGARGNVAVSNMFKVKWLNSFLTAKNMYFQVDSREEPVNFTVVVPDNTTANYNLIVSWGNDSNGNLVTTTYNNVKGQTLNITRANLLDLSRFSPEDITITNRAYVIGVSLQVTANIGVNLILSEFTCNTNIVRIYDAWGLLFNAKVNISSSPADYRFEHLPYKIKELNIANTISSDDVDNLIVYSAIEDYININNTNIIGNFDSLITIPTILADNSKISKYNGNTQPIVTTYNIVWKNSDIEVESLNRLLIALDFSTAVNGILDISGDNPEITDLTALQAIDNLFAKGWNITFNTFSMVVDDEGSIIVDSDGNVIGDGTSETINLDPDAPTFDTVTIGTQTWMCKNLDIDDGLGGIYAYDDNEANVEIFGYHYAFSAAERIANSIDGWRLPTKEDFETLITYLGGAEVAGGKLKSTSDNWIAPNEGADNSSGWGGEAGGFYFPDDCYDKGYNGYWWSSTQYDQNGLYYILNLASYLENASIISDNAPISVRLIKSE